MTKHSRKIRKNEKVESPIVEEQVGSTQEVLDSMQEGANVPEPAPEPTTEEQTAETSQDVPETVEEPATDTGTEQQAAGSEEPSEDVGEETLNEQVEEPVLNESENVDPFKDVPAPEQDLGDNGRPTTGRKAKLSDDSMLKVLFTENPQRKGTYSHGYNETLMSEENLTVAKAMELGIPRHHLLYLSKEGKIEVINA